MTVSQPRFCFFSGNALKIIAVFAMICDHLGVFFFPTVRILRIIGRIAFPIFAFMISEGAAHTKNRLRYFLTIASVAVLMQSVYFLYDRSLNMCVFVTFTLSLISIFPLEMFKSELFNNERNLAKICLYGSLFALSVALSALLNNLVFIEYGFCGCMTPVLASFFRAPKSNPPKWFEKTDLIPIHVLMCGIGLVCVAFTRSTLQWYALLALPLLFLYSGKRGKLRLKYFFYIFYPVHLAIFEIISDMIK